MSAPGTTERLRTEPLTVLGRMPYSSNATLLVAVGEVPAGLGSEAGLERLAASGALLAVYKPARGERPLWDFPSGLYTREIAAYELSEALGWDLVPTTVLRGADPDDNGAPLGEGSVQRFVDADFEEHYFTLLEDDAHHDDLRRICVFDLLANNTDRKGGHVLLDKAGHLWCIDNGLSFHQEFKLRTVIWDFAGEPIPDALRDDVCRVLLDGGVPDTVACFLDPFEIDALRTRARAVVAEGRFPIDTTGRRYPWPMV